MRIFENCFVFIMFVLGTIIVIHGNSEFNNEMLRLHNKYRKIHHSGELQLVDFLSEKAADCALKVLERNLRSCADNGMYGINLYNFESLDHLTAEVVFLKWYNNGNSYIYTMEPEFCTDIDYFTQIVWLGTRSLGVAFLQGKGRDVVVAVYSPPGNVRDMYLDNVLQP